MATESVATTPMRYFAAFYSVFGVRLEYELNRNSDEIEVVCPMASGGRRLNCGKFGGVYLIPRLLFICAYVVFVIGVSCYFATRFPSRPSVLDFIRILYYILSFVIILYGGAVLNWYAATISDILFWSDEFPCQFYVSAFIYPMMLSLPSIIVDVEDAFETMLLNRPLIVKLGHLFGVYLWQVQYAVICMYVQCEAVVQGQLEHVTRMAKSLPISVESVEKMTRAKLSIRRTIENVNTVFGNVLLVCYMKLFTLFTLRFGKLVLWNGKLDESWLQDSIYFLTECLQITQIFETTRRGSAIIVETQRAEKALLMPQTKRLNEESVAILSELRSIVAYREDLDTLKISDSFVNRKATMLTYLGTLFTCVAIVLQFDHNVLRVLQMGRTGGSLQSK